MKKILVTGFEPFGGESINPSWEAVSLLPDVIGGYTLTKLRIPVVFGEATERIIEKAKEICPDVILCVGQAGGRNAITPEFVGINLRHAEIPDNNGKQPQDEPIIKGGENAYFTTLPIRKIVEKLKEAGLPSAVSYSAGSYVCNDVIYSLLAKYKDTQTKVGFIHIPYCTEQNKTPSLALGNVVKGLRIAIENI